MATARKTGDVLEIAKSTIGGHTVVHKFGRNVAVGTSFVPVCIGGAYRVPQVASATTLRIAAGNAADASDQAGARKVYIQGLDATGAEVSEELTTAGVSASSVSSNSYIRLYRAYVSESGTYSDLSAGSHEANIVIENGAGGTTWATITDDNGVSGNAEFARGQSEIGCYTVPLGQTAYIYSLSVFSNSAKVTDILMMQRRNILQTSAPYDALRVVVDKSVEGGGTAIPFEIPVQFPALTDILLFARVNTATDEVTVDFEIVLVAD